MRKRTRIMIATAAAVGAGAVPAVAIAGGDVDVAITGPELAQATSAALTHTGEGLVTGTEVGDEESYYEVEVTLPDGSQVDVQLDAGFNVVGAESDGSEAEGEDAD